MEMKKSTAEPPRMGFVNFPALLHFHRFPPAITVHGAIIPGSGSKTNR